MMRMQSILFMSMFLVGMSVSHLSEAKSTNIEEHEKWKEFVDYTRRYKKHYDLNEMSIRFDVYQKNVEHIAKHNMDRSHSYKLGINQYADMTEEEFRVASMKGCYIPLVSETLFSKLFHTCEPFTHEKSNSTPSNIDWRNKGAVTSVKNQEQCGSCWSFSATGAMEGAHQIATGELINLSEQQLVDCSGSYGNKGCNGGVMSNAFEYGIDKGMCSAQDYPYDARMGICEKCDVVAKFDTCYNVEKNNELALKQAVALGPVSVAIEADTSIFQLYKSGVINSTSCGTQLDHGVLIVGYGTENNKDYWLVKNSWGNTWGEEGYVKIARSNNSNSPGICGIAMTPSFPIAISTVDRKEL